MINKKFICFKVSDADSVFFLLLFVTGLRKRNASIPLFVSAGAQKRWKTVYSRSTLPQYLANPKTLKPVH